MDNILEIKNLSVCFEGYQNEVISNLNLSIKKSEIMGLVGESGSGKSLTALSILNLLPTSARISSGQILVNGKSMDNKKVKNVAIILQDPTTSLNPLKSVGKQMLEVIWKQSDFTKKAELKSHILKWLQKVNLPSPSMIFNKYPNELSGGQQQRVMIALALALKPKLLIADEPTTALDSTVQKEILQLLKQLVKEQQSSLLIISHDLKVIGELCDKVTIIRAGKVVESSSTQTIFNNPQSAYTNSLISSRPKIEHTPDRLLTLDDHLKGKSKFIKKQYRNLSGAKIVEVRGLSYHYISKKMLPTFKGKYLALDDINLRIFKGEVLGVVGESGSGKTTLAENIALLKTPCSGSIAFDGQNIEKIRNHDLKNLRRDFQYIFQSNLSALNPFFTIEEILSEPLKIHKISSKENYKRLTGDILEKVGLSRSDLNKYPREFSGDRDNESV